MKINLSDPQTAEDYIWNEIPIAKSLSLKVLKTNPNVEVELPIQENKNNKDTAFAGSMASGCFLAGWLTVQIEADQVCKSDVFISKSSIDYLLPITADFQVIMNPIQDKNKSLFLKMLERKGKAKVAVSAQIVSQGKTCARFSGEYAALKN